MNWKAWFNYKAPGLNGRTHGLYLVPVGYFSVLGGDVRVIDLTSPQDEGVITSELGQAKAAKNIRLFLEVTENMDILFDMLEISARGMFVSFELAVQGSHNGQLAVGYRLVALNAKTAQPQDQSSIDKHTGKRFLRTRFEFANASVFQGFAHYSPFMRYKWSK